jgi:hypothetical protein
MREVVDDTGTQGLDKSNMEAISANAVHIGVWLWVWNHSAPGMAIAFS